MEKLPEFTAEVECGGCHSGFRISENDLRYDPKISELHNDQDDLGTAHTGGPALFWDCDDCQERNGFYAFNVPSRVVHKAGLLLEREREAALLDPDIDLL